MLAYLSRLVPAEHLEDYSYLCIRRSDARLLLLTPCAPLLPCGDAPILFLSHEGLFYKKSLSPQKIRGQQGDKREKVKRLKYLFTISYRLSLFPASDNNLSAPVSSSFRALVWGRNGQNDPHPNQSGHEIDVVQFYETPDMPLQGNSQHQDDATGKSKQREILSR